MSIFNKIKQISEGSLKKVVDSVKETQSIHSFLMVKVTEIDYSKPLLFLQENKNRFPKSSVLISSLETLQEASLNYKTSEVENKEKIFFKHIYNTIEVSKAIDELEPIVNFVPYGNLIMIVLKMIVKK